MPKSLKGTPSPLYDLLNEINAAAQRMPRLAVAMAVALPDICVSLVSDDGRSNGERYRQWCADNLGEGYFGMLKPDDLWSMRCGVLHNGRYGDLKHSVAGVMFLLPNQGATVLNCTVNDTYFYSVADFCKAFTDCVHQWSEKNRDHPNMIANLPRLMQYRTATIPPFFNNVQVLA